MREKEAQGWQQWMGTGRGELTFAHSDKVGAKSSAIFGLAHSES